MERLIAIGDIHGCYHTYKQLLFAVNYSAATDTLVFIGDYIDRGEYASQVVDEIRELQEDKGKDRVICLKGNHEEMMIRAFQDDFDPINKQLNVNGDSAVMWYINGGQKTIQNIMDRGKDPLAYVSWFKTLPLSYVTDKHIFCHAGLTHPILKDNQEEDLLWGREWIFFDRRTREKQVVFGHTPLVKRPYTTKSGDICIDGGCVYGGTLCAYIIYEDGTTDGISIPKDSSDE